MRPGSKCATIVRRFADKPLPPLPSRRTAAIAETVPIYEAPVIQIDDRADIYTSIAVGEASALRYSYTVADNERQVRYLLREIRRGSGEIYAALHAIAADAQTQPVTLRPDLDDPTSWQRAEVIRLCIVYRW